LTSNSSYSLPLIEEVCPAPAAEEAFLQMCRLPHCLFFDSAKRHPALSRFSFVSADPFLFLQYPADGCDAMIELADRMRGWCWPTVPDLPPFQGGVAGVFSYDLARSLECIPPPKRDEFQVPALAVGFYDVVLAFDHVTGQAWIVSQGFPETEPRRRQQRAEARLAEVRRWLADRHPNKTQAHAESLVPDVASDQLARQYPIEGQPGITSNFDREGYLGAVQRAIDYIYAGDVFQVNLSQRLLCPAGENAVSLYQRLRQCNPAPFAGYFDTGDFQIVSASPERFLSVRDGRVEARPIKGTRPRTGDSERDRQSAADLLASQKDRAENVMIVDLLRNDLSRVCEPESVRVGQLCEIEAYQHVLHLVSAIHGTLRTGCSPIDLLRAAFPGGSITGAPKVRAMEIIAELEPTARGPYCGSLGYLGFDGSLDLSVLIRTITAGRGWWQCQVGGGIVAQSSPELEYAETWQKAQGLLQAMASG
jgi:para-aminobenzoate synthetase component 1